MKLSSQQRKLLVEPADPEMSIRRQCRLLSVNRSMLYYKPAGESSLNLELMELIDQIHMLCPEWGSPKMTEFLSRMGYCVNHKRIERLMRLMGIRAIYARPRTTLTNADHKVYAYLLRDLEISRPNQVWCTDITYIPVENGFFYLVAIMDWYSRYVLSWELSNSMETQFCIEALSTALAGGRPEIFNSDQGSQFTSMDFTQVLLNENIAISMDGKGCYMDNIFIERLWRSLKYDEVYLHRYAHGHQAWNGINKWMTKYNQFRPHEALGFRTPEEVYLGLPKRQVTLEQLAAI